MSAVEQTPQPVTPAMRRQLRIIRDSMPLGCTRAKGGWFGTAGNISLRDAPLLTAQRLAAIDYRGRYPRLKITAKGRNELSERETP